MRNIKKQIVNFLKEEEGLTMVEYAVAGGLITLGAVLAFQTLGTSVSTQIGNIDAAVNTPPVP